MLTTLPMLLQAGSLTALPAAGLQESNTTDSTYVSMHTTKRQKNYFGVYHMLPIEIDSLGL